MICALSLEYFTALYLSIYLPLPVNYTLPFNVVAYCPFLSTWQPLCSISCTAGLVLTNSLNFCLYRKFYLSFISQKRLAMHSILGWQIFSPRILNILSHSLLAFKDSAKNCAGSLSGVPLYVMSLLFFLFSNFSF